MSNTVDASRSDWTRVVMLTPASSLDRLPADGRDPDATDLDRLGASLHDLAFCSSKSDAHEAGDHVAIEPMGAHKQCLGSTMRAAGE
jgi:hypothetical protein